MNDSGATQQTTAPGSPAFVALAHCEQGTHRVNLLKRLTAWMVEFVFAEL